MKHAPKPENPAPCRLCGKVSVLCRSHILPELVHARAYDLAHRVLEIRRGSGSLRKVQMVQRERLLCQACEAHLNRWEQYFNRTWYRQVPTLLDVPSNELLVTVDYPKFKLFHLSVIWRMSVASVPGFEHFKLAGDEEERLRDHILGSNPGDVNYWRLAGALLLFPGSRRPCHGVISGPTSHEVPGRQSWSAVFGACAWMYFPDGTLFPEFEQFALDLKGQMRLRVYDLRQYTPVHRSFVEAVAEISRNRTIAPEV